MYPRRSMEMNIKRRPVFASPVNYLKKRRRLVVMLFVAILFVFEVLALAYWAFYPYWSSGQIFSDTEESIYAIVSYASPILLVGILDLCLARLVLPFVATILPRQAREFILQVSRLPVVRLRTEAVKSDFFKSPIQKVLVILGIVSGMLLAYSPYRPDINPFQQFVGIDTPLYLGWVTQMLQRPLGLAVAYAFGVASEGSRPLLFLLLYSLVSSGLEVGLVIRAFPMVLAPLLAVSAY